MKMVIYSVFGGFGYTTLENYRSYPMDINKVQFFYKKDGFETYLDVEFSIDNHENFRFFYR